MSPESKHFATDQSATRAYLYILNGRSVESFLQDLDYQESLKLLDGLYSIALSKHCSERTSEEQNAYIEICAYYIFVNE